MLCSEDGEDVANRRFGNLNLSILGLGTEYPPYPLIPSDLDTLVQRHYPESPAYAPHLSLISLANNQCLA